MSRPASLEAWRGQLQDAATHLGRGCDMRFRPMFGGLMAYLDEQPCAWLAQAGIALKLPVDQQPALLRLAGAKRLTARPGAAPSRSYIVLPPSLARDTARLADWLQRSVPGASRDPC